MNLEPDDRFVLHRLTPAARHHSGGRGPAGSSARAPGCSDAD